MRLPAYRQPFWVWRRKGSKEPYMYQGEPGTSATIDWHPAMVRPVEHADNSPDLLCLIGGVSVWRGG